MDFDVLLFEWFVGSVDGYVQRLRSCNIHYSSRDLSKYHLEGDAWSHTCLVFHNLRGIASPNVLLAALCHDLEVVLRATYAFPMAAINPITVLQLIAFHMEPFQWFARIPDDYFLPAWVPISSSPMQDAKGSARDPTVLAPFGRKCLDSKYRRHPGLLEALSQLHFADLRGSLSMEPFVAQVSELQQAAISNHAAPLPMSALELASGSGVGADVQSPGSCGYAGMKGAVFNLCVGVSGSGKSTYIAKEMESLGLGSSDVFIGSTDDACAKLVPNGNMEARFAYLTQNDKKVYDSLFQSLEEALRQGKTIYWDQTNLTVKSRRRKLARVFAHNHRAGLAGSDAEGEGGAGAAAASTAAAGASRYVVRCLVFHAGFGLVDIHARQRLAATGDATRNLPRSRLLQSIQRMQLPSFAEGFDEIAHLFYGRMFVERKGEAMVELKDPCLLDSTASQGQVLAAPVLPLMNMEMPLMKAETVRAVLAAAVPHLPKARPESQTPGGGRGRGRGQGDYRRNDWNSPPPWSGPQGRGGGYNRRSGGHSTPDQRKTADHAEDGQTGSRSGPAGVTRGRNRRNDWGSPPQWVPASGRNKKSGSIAQVKQVRAAEPAKEARVSKQAASQKVIGAQIDTKRNAACKSTGSVQKKVPERKEDSQAQSLRETEGHRKHTAGVNEARKEGKTAHKKGGPEWKPVPKVGKTIPEMASRTLQDKRLLASQTGKALRETASPSSPVSGFRSREASRFSIFSLFRRKTSRKEVPNLLHGTVVSRRKGNSG